MLERYNPARLSDGDNIVNGDEVFYVSNPALGLWAHGDRFAATREERDLWQQLTPSR
jgi:hypothetical protein